MRAVHHDTEGSRLVAHDRWQSLILERGYQAVIFDCDGTLVESAEAHFLSFRDAALAQGEKLDLAWYTERTGLDRQSLLHEFGRHASSGFDVDQAVRVSIAAFRTHLHLVRRVPETSSLLLALSENLPIAVGTNAETEVAEASLTAVGLIDAIQCIVSISDGLPPKPAPDIFTNAAKKIGCSARSALVIEDSPQGVRSAKSAGMDVLEVAI